MHFHSVITTSALISWQMSERYVIFLPAAAAPKSRVQVRPLLPEN